jgi:dissimilatory sulfite reductase related protein
MQTQVANQLVDFNEEGFLLDSAQWTPEVAEALAKKAGITLTPEHWKVLTFCREEAVKAGQSPGPRRITQGSGVTMKRLYELFPKGPGKLAAQIAGLPKPKSCL